jgi:hypothetical protein
VLEKPGCRVSGSQGLKPGAFKLLDQPFQQTFQQPPFQQPFQQQPFQQLD